MKSNGKKLTLLLVVCVMLFSACNMGGRNDNGTADDRDGIIENKDGTTNDTTNNNKTVDDKTVDDKTVNDGVDKNGDNIVDDVAEGTKDLANGAADAVGDVAEGTKNATNDIIKK